MNEPSKQPAKSPPEPDLPRPDLSGRQLGDYRLLRRLGHGAMAEIYLAEQCSLKRRVAFKVLKKQLADDQTYLKRFHREAEAAASLVHANIVQIHEVGCIDHVHFIAQEYVEGLNLRQWIRRNDPPDLPHALSIIRQVAAALAKAAQQGIVHRDIKPENILLTRAGEVKVADFGLARLPQQREGVDLTQVGITMGTPLYMSPEQVEGKSLDPRSDLYSLGVTCYHMLAGSPPFTGQTPLSVAVQHLKKEPEPLQGLRSDLPEDLCRTVHKMLAKDPGERYQSARQLLHDLRRIQMDHLGGHWPEDLPGWESTALESIEGSSAEATLRIQSSMETAALAVPRTPRRAPWIAALAVAVLLGGTLAWWTMRPTPMLDGGNAPAPTVHRRETALLQWLYASRIGTEEAWRGVIEYFPEKPYYVRRAKQQLARIYLRERNDPAALDIFRELAEANPNDKELRAFGLAGQCIVLTLQGNYKQSARLWDEFWPIRRQLRDGQMREGLNHAVKRNCSELGQVTAEKWSQWFEEQFSEDG
jgi:serine/threonine-protein kinase